MEKSGKSEVIIEDAGCGVFQAIQFVLVFFVSYGAVAFTVHLMSFGNYNPGWRCLDTVNNTIQSRSDNATIVNNVSLVISTSFGRSNNGNNSAWNESLKFESVTTAKTSEKYVFEDCPAYESCQNVEFNPAASTIVTEWGLLCDKAWIPSFIITLQMVGYLIGSITAGVLGDAYGRKFVIYVAFVLLLIFNTISTFSTSWQLFAGMRLLLGIVMSFPSTLCYVYVAEFVPTKWRAIVLGLPYYPLTVVLFGVTCYIFKDWHQIQITLCILSAFAVLPVFWLPESLRWLEVKNKKEKFQNAVKKIAKYNRKSIKYDYDEQDSFEAKADKEMEQTFKNLIKNTVKLFGKEYRKCTMLLSVPWCIISILYFAVAFGVKAFSGNFYLNLTLFYFIEVFIDFAMMFVPNLFGRKKAGVAFTVVAGLCFLLAACFHKYGSEILRSYGISSLVMFGRISISLFWTVMQIVTVEIYPTVARGAANGWGLIMARIGGIIAPSLIPTAADTMFTCYTVMAVLAVVCAIVVLLLPETKGKALLQFFTQKEDFYVGNNNDTEV